MDIFLVSTLSHASIFSVIVTGECDQLIISPAPLVTTDQCPSPADQLSPKQPVAGVQSESQQRHQHHHHDSLQTQTFQLTPDLLHNSEDL